jgi:hypothetical protein
MADIKISQMTPATLPLNGAELVPLVQNGANVQTGIAGVRGLFGVSGDLVYNSTTGVFSFSERTDQAVRNLFSAVDSGGDGSFAYNSTTGAFTYTGPSAAEVRAHFTGGTGVTIVDGVVAIGQNVGTNSAVTFNTVTANTVVYGSNGTLRGANTTTTSTAQFTLSSFAAALYRSAKYVIQAVSAAESHVTELLVTHDGVAAVSTEYGILYTDVELFTVTADIDSGNVRVRVTPASATSTVFRIVENLLL